MRQLDRLGLVFVAVLALAAILVPVLSLATPADFAVQHPALSGAAARQVSLLRHPRRRARSRLGLLRHPVARPRRVLRARRLRDGHVSDAPDRRARRLRQPDPARLHGVPELEGAAGRLVGLQLVSLRHADGRARSRAAGARLRLVRLPLARHRRLSLDHHPGDDLRAVQGVLPQRLRLRRQQRPDRFQGPARLLAAVGLDQGGAVLGQRDRAHRSPIGSPARSSARNTARR